MKKNSHPTVYSTAHGRIPAPIQKSPTTIPARDGIVRISRQTKGRKGKGVTIISGIPLDTSGLQTLAQELKRKCGSGGTIKEGIIEIQGDHRDKLYADLVGRGWQVKHCGG